MEDRQRERGRLTGARLGASADVSALHNVGDCLLLNWGGNGVTFVPDGTQQGLSDPEIIELFQNNLS